LEAGKTGDDAILGPTVCRPFGYLAHPSTNRREVSRSRLGSWPLTRLMSTQGGVSREVRFNVWRLKRIAYGKAPSPTLHGPSKCFRVAAACRFIHNGSYQLCDCSN